MNEKILINNLRHTLFECYSKELCYPKIASEWSEDNKTLGMCAITALVVNDYLGGEICKIYVDGTSHYFNNIGGRIIDLTEAQFNRSIDHSGSIVVNRVDILSNNNTLTRYNLLKHLVANKNITGLKTPECHFDH